MRRKWEEAGVEKEWVKAMIKVRSTQEVVIRLCTIRRAIGHGWI